MNRARWTAFCLIAAVFFTACAGRRNPAERWTPPTRSVDPAVTRLPDYPAPPREESPRPAGSWSTLEQIPRGTRLIVYLKDGVRLEGRHLGAGPDGLFLESGRYERAAVAAVVPPPENLGARGALLGAALGMGVLYGTIGWRGDFSAAGLLSVAALGAGVGAACGALVGTGLAKSQEPFHIEGEVSDPAGRRWRIQVEPEHLANWISGRTVDLMLRDGSHLKGEVLGGDSGSIRIRVAESSAGLRKGQPVEIGSDRVSTVVFRERSGGQPGAAAFGGGLTGFLVGSGVGAALTSESAVGPAVVAGLGAVLGGAAAAGMARDRNRREITLIVATRP